ncbi:Gfo/Idh/MocA family protein [Allosalinactinospora lopnorensis]|uniref:Gfo/Idh/MocA family protein n=1 Tax=Allosalinactinospora lopnorensis TaxID=1352348 RepID=UPI000623EEEA|nr:Gfo/Idh/MocA family oxidoreductase [Allosalinactinospora lopnorensis]
MDIPRRPEDAPAVPVRAAIVGTGTIARFHIEALQSMPDQVETVAAVDVAEENLARFGARYGIPGRYSDLPEMLCEAAPDLVHICTPPALHREQVVTCLKAGVSVLVEKPPALSLAEFEDMASAEGGQGPWVATLFQHRFGSGARRVRALVAVCHTTWYREQSYFDVPWRGRWETEGGGPTMGHGIHQMDLLTALLGDWVEVSATAHQQARDVETEDISLAHVTFANGAVASVVNSLVSSREESYIRIDFEHATIELPHLYGYGDDDWRVTPAPGFEETVMAAWRAGESGVNSGHAAQITHVVAAVRAKQAPPVTSADSLRTLRLVAGVYASAFQRRPVTPADLGPGSPFHDRMNGDGPRW